MGQERGVAVRPAGAPMVPAERPSWAGPGDGSGQVVVVLIGGQVHFPLLFFDALLERGGGLGYFVNQRTFDARGGLAVDL